MDTQWRIRIVAWGFGIAWLVVVARLFYWQVVKGEELAAMAVGQHEEDKWLVGERGEIVAEDGSVLVTSKPGYDLFADLAKVDRAKITELAGKLSEGLFDDKVLDWVEASQAAEIKDQRLEERGSELKDKLSKGDRGWVGLARGVSEQQRERVGLDEDSGLVWEKRALRYHPEGSMAAHLLGFVGSNATGEDQGYFGLEGYYNRELSGRSGQLLQERDAWGRPILVGGYQEVEEVAGAKLVTTIDRAVQYLVEQKMASGLERYGAAEGTVTVMDPKSGGILAMVALPDYDPDYYQEFPNERYINPVVAGSFEPGSVMKVVVMALAWDAGKVDEKVVCPCGGPVEIGKYTIRTWNNEYHPKSSVSDIIAYSDNVGMVWVAERLGTKKLVEGLEKFGFGEKTGVDLQDETAVGLRSEEKWGEIDRAVAAFGQGIAVTPLQMVRAVVAIANGGELLTPRVVREISFDGKTTEMADVRGTRVISKQTSEAIKEMMVKAVDEGEAKWAKPKGYRIAGKTGTAQIPVAGHYDEEKTIASFVGFAPADDPKFVMLVTLREPETSPWGSETAAPLWFEIANEMLVYWGVGGS